MPKTNHRLQSMVLFLKKSRISAFFYSPFLPNPIGGFLTLLTPMANADIICYMCQQRPVGANWTVDASCTGTSCRNCKTTTSTRNGVITTTTATMRSNCPTGLTGTITCSCSRTYSYKCAAGYYGQPKSAFVGQCTECPGNGTSASACHGPSIGSAHYLKTLPPFKSALHIYLNWTSAKPLLSGFTPSPVVPVVRDHITLQTSTHPRRC